MVVASNVDVVMPQMGSSVTEGTISRWLKQVGDTVQADETIVEISTDKVDTEVPAPTAGVVLELLVAEGVTVDVGTRIAVLSTDLSAKPAAAPVAAPPAEVAAPVAAEPVAAPVAAEPVAAPVAAVAAAPAVAERALVTQLAATGEDRAFVSPVVARMVAEHQLDITQIDGTGRGGRVTKKDVENFLAAHASGGGYAAPMAESTAITAPAVAPVAAPPAHKAPAQAPAAPAAALPAAPAAAMPAAPAGNREEIYTFSRVRQVTAKHMRESIETAAHVTQVWEVDLGRVTDIRNRLKPKFKNDYGVSLSFLPFVMRATVEAMAAWPWMNAEVRENDAVIKRYVNLGMAVSVDDGKGLMVPAIKNAETLNLLGLAQAVADLAVRGRSKKLTIDDLTGGTFTITNPGVFGSLYGTPILPVGQVGILDTGAIVRRPMVVEGPDGSEAIAIRPMMYLSISYDHRLIDGAYASQFMAQIRTNLQTWDEEAYGA